ncbi:MAG: TIGR00270 family protein [Candidatus Diapherotrites archaeon]|nr:TIGR00270 family protein [Candidatus Diapherotrites archaeon]
MDCELCGKNTLLSETRIDGVPLMVCVTCRGNAGQSNYSPPVPLRANPSRTPRETPHEVILVPDFGQRIQRARAKMGLTHEELAAKVFERESVIRKFELGKITPSAALVKKIEKFLSIELEEK